MKRDNQALKGKISTHGGWTQDTFNIESHDHDDAQIGFPEY